VSEALYLPTATDGAFDATESTVGPWDPKLQPGGPPSALLARAAERHAASWPGTVVRMAVEILGPIPVGQVTVTSAVTRSGRSVELVEAELAADGRVAARAHAWRIRQAELELPELVAVPTEHPPLPPETVDEVFWRCGFLESMEFRYTTGGWNVPGPATMWARLTIPLVADEEISGLQRLMTLADCGNGVSGALSINQWVFINPELTVHLARYPEGEWMCIDAETTVDRHGYGVATSTLYDLAGRVGHGAQSLFVDRR
jgi:hypothetical protein